MTEKPIIATATSTVSNGKSSTSTLNYSQGYSRSNLIPGNTYQINGAYQENNHYNYAEGIGTLEMLKCPTTITLSANSSVNIGENLTININVVEGINNTSISRGYVTIYDGNQIIQSNHVITGSNTQITFNSNVPGTHDIYAVFTDSGVEYNSSNSNHLSIVVTKISTKVVVDEICSTEGEYSVYQNNETSFSSYVDNVRMNIPQDISFTITGRIVDSNNNALSDTELEFINYDNSSLHYDTTDSEGKFELIYASDLSANQQNVTIAYHGTNQYDSSSSSLFVNNYYLPQFANFNKYYSPNDNITYLVPITNSTDVQYLPQMMRIISQYDYVGLICNMSSSYIETEKYYHEFANALEDNYFYFIGYVDPSLVDNDNDIYMYIGTVAINSNQLQDINFYYNEDAEEKFGEVMNYFPDLEQTFADELDTRGWQGFI